MPSLVPVPRNSIKKTGGVTARTIDAKIEKYFVRNKKQFGTAG